MERITMRVRERMEKEMEGEKRKKCEAAKIITTSCNVNDARY